MVRGGAGGRGDGVGLGVEGREILQILRRRKLIAAGMRVMQGGGEGEGSTCLTWKEVANDLRESAAKKKWGCGNEEGRLGAMTCVALAARLFDERFPCLAGANGLRGVVQHVRQLRIELEL